MKIKCVSIRIRYLRARKQAVVVLHSPHLLDHGGAYTYFSLVNALLLSVCERRTAIRIISLFFRAGKKVSK